MLYLLLNLFFGRFFIKLYITLLWIDIHGYPWNI